MSHPVAQIQPMQGDRWWMSLHNGFLRDAKKKQPEVVLIGDSLIANLCESRLWQEKFEPLHCLNFGIGGDRTQHVLWRVLNGELDEIKPKVIVLLVGTNNYDEKSDKVTEGILAVVRAIQDRQPLSNIIVLGLLPKGEMPNPWRDKNSAINKRLAEELKTYPLTTFLKIDDKEFMTSDGIITRDVMYDFLHLTEDIGYQKLCDPLLEEIQKLLDACSKVGNTPHTAS